MSSKPCSLPASATLESADKLVTETIHQPWGETPLVDLTLRMRVIDATPNAQELHMAFQMLDSLLLSLPYEEWEV